MSTILNALKRLEDEGGANGVDEVAMPLRGPSATSGSKSRRLMVTLAGLVLLVGGGVFSWVFYDWPGGPFFGNDAQPSSPPVDTAPAQSPPAPSAAPAPEGRTETARPEARDNDERIPPEARTGKRVNARTIVTSPGYLPPNPEGEMHQALPRRPASAESSTIPNSPAQTSMDPPPRTGEMPPPGPVGPPSDHQDPYALAEVVARDTLQLQAISWSDTPTVRITIISGRILREGQNVDGYTVVEIRPKDVILQKAGKHWKLVYDGR